MLVLSMMLVLVGCNSATQKDEAEQSKKETNEDKFLNKVDEHYAYEFAKSLEQFKTNDKLGYRTAGSEAELQTGEHIQIGRAHV